MKTTDIESALRKLRTAPPSQKLEERIQSDLQALSGRRRLPIFALTAALIISLGFNIYFISFNPVEPVGINPMPASIPSQLSITVEPTPGDFDSQPILKRN